MECERPHVAPRELVHQCVLGTGPEPKGQAGSGAPEAHLVADSRCLERAERPPAESPGAGAPETGLGVLVTCIKQVNENKQKREWGCCGRAEPGRGRCDIGPGSRGSAGSGEAANQGG